MEATLPVVVVGSVVVVVVFGSTGPTLPQQYPPSHCGMRLQHWSPQQLSQQQPCGMIVVPEKKSC